MKQILIPFSFALLALAACKQDNKQSGQQQGDTAQENPTVLAGHWFTMDFCARAAQYGSVVSAMNNGHVPYAYALTFDPAHTDSVQCFNGMETWNVAVSYKVDTLELKNARGDGKSVFLAYDSKGNRNMTMFDNSPAGMQMDMFVKSKAGTRDGYTAFLTALNHNMFNGNFTPIGKAAAAEPITFTPGGFLTGMKEFDRYELCVAGDCFVSGEKVDIITFSNHLKEGSEKIFGYKYDGGNDTLSLFNMVDKNPNEKGVYVLGALAYKLARKRSQ